MPKNRKEMEMIADQAEFAYVNRFGIFDTLDQYYAADARRRWSPECDYGCSWTGSIPGNHITYRVSYVKETKEIYIIPTGCPDNELQVIARISQPPGASVYFGRLDKILQGWEEEMYKPNSLKWLKEKLGEYHEREKEVADADLKEAPEPVTAKKRSKNNMEEIA